MSSLDYLDLCRLCLVKDRVSVPIFEGEGDARQIFLKITACLPVKVNKEDKLPKKICDDCVYKIELCYQFWHTTANAEKQLLQWLGEVNMEDKQGYNVLNPNGMKPEQSNENRLDGTVMQQISEHQNNMNMGMMDNMGLSMPMMMPSNTQQQITSVPMDNSGSSVQNVQSVAGPSTQQTTHDQITQNQTEAPTQQEEEEESSEEEENSDDECDGDEGLPIKEESEEDPNNSRTIEPTTFVNVSLACDEAGPSGLQQQKIADMPEMVMPQAADVDPKTGYFVSKLTVLPQDQQQCGSSKITQIILTQDYRQLLTESNAKVPSNIRRLVQKRVLQCEFCGDCFTSDQALNSHLETHESYSEEETRQQEDEQLVCEHCGCSFMTTPELHEHQKEHVSEEYFSCDSCDYVTSDRESLIAHEHCHVSDYKYQCEVCGEEFQNKSNCQVHLLSHTQEKQFQCDICNATFRYRQGLRLHAKLHQPDYVAPQRKHHCELCNKRFSRKQVLLVHMKTHGNVEPQNEYVCPICSKSVSSKTYLAVHLRKHTGEKPHVCDVCGKGFISQNYLSVHRRTHTGEKPHQCVHCNKRFTQRTTLVVHLRGHTGDRPYPCTCCHKSFASKTMLNSHLKTHAKQNAQQRQQQEVQQPPSLEPQSEDDPMQFESVTVMM
ncbi:zinc finger and SCAN domain-containing protein 2-like isoform X5 [Pogonomyrmex barbatus]|uniref:Zinc finger and SCAN domain-containing protein 2-like isoform X5 n=1 Tax=Pogonomyrmex barbatus TaxID=144034 RepID=A0A8N1S6P3_9HYME|nr:zinc finger and SCAN domain-containing protein 2-like isoform X5 [Pogonomyrmex barbatus]